MTIREHVQPAITALWRAVLAEGRDGDVKVTTTPTVSLVGLGELMQNSEKLVTDALAEQMPSRLSLYAFAFSGTAVFWVFLIGPLVTVYLQYFHAFFVVYGSGAMISAFPEISLSMLKTRSFSPPCRCFSWHFYSPRSSYRASGLRNASDQSVTSIKLKFDDGWRMGVFGLRLTTMRSMRCVFYSPRPVNR